MLPVMTTNDCSASEEFAHSMPNLMPGWVDPCDFQSMVKLRRDIHANPEPGWGEFRATAQMAERLGELGFALHFGPEFINPQYVRGRNPAEAARERAAAAEAGVTPVFLARMGDYPGLVAVWDTGRAGKTLAIRVELDALYLEEPKGDAHIPAREGFSSRRLGLMHACGHDGHQAVAWALARFIAANAERLAGRVIFIFQPAEEGSRGAYPILKSGILDGVDILLCAHLGLSVDLGTVVAAPDKFLCTTKIDFEFVGKPSHAGMQPQVGRNALLAAANSAVNIMGLPRHGDGMTRVNVGSLHAGEGRNVIPSHATMEVEVRGENASINQALAAEAIQRAEGMSAAFGVELKKRIVGEAIDYVPDDYVTQLITICARRARGCDRVVPTLPYNGSDDGTLLIRRVQEQGGRAGYFVVGAALSGSAPETACDFDERAMLTLYDTYAQLIMAFLGNWHELN